MTPRADDPDPELQRPRTGRGWRWLAITVLGGLATLSALTLSLAPSIPAPGVPDSAAVDAARGVLSQISKGDAKVGERLNLRLSQAQLDGMADLASQALAPLRAKAQLMPGARKTYVGRVKSAPPRARQPDRLVVLMSRPLPLGLWVNIAATARHADGAAAAGLPDIDLRIGRLPVPQWLTHMLLSRAWQQLQGDVARPLTLKDAIGRITITASHIELAMAHPGRGAALAGLAQASGTVPDSQTVTAAYCALASQPATDLAALVRRAFTLPARDGVTPQEHNRALLTAIAMRTVPEYRDRLAGATLPMIARCVPDAAPLLLAGRDDLAKHWALSAALAATLGGQMAQSMGTWKELADSIEGGSGFSFVDLAADRSGERFGNAGVNPMLARAVQTRLGAITQPQMLPAELLVRPEGLDQAAFEREYRMVDSPEYARALAAIDMLLDQAGVPTR